MTIFKAPDWTWANTSLKGKSVFLAGSIEMGVAVDWQTEVGSFFEASGITVFNPRRDDWDSSWKQSIEDVKFEEQVRWELDAISFADAVLLYLHPDTKAPISLLEFGICSQMKPDKTFVVCPEGFYRKGNVEIVCARYKVSLSGSLMDGMGRCLSFLLRPKFTEARNAKG